MSTIFRKRLKLVNQFLNKGAESSALVLSSAPELIRNRDTHYPYRYDSDFYYLSGCDEPGFALLLSSNAKTPIFFTTPVDPVKTIWEGKSRPAKSYAASIGAELIITKDIHGEIRKRLKGIAHLYYQNLPQSIGWQVASGLIALPSYSRADYPARFSHSDLILERLRLYKDATEVAAIEAAARITNLALWSALPSIVAGFTEGDIVSSIDGTFRSHGATPAFQTIVAPGVCAATLHHRPANRKLRNGDLLLIDCGAEADHYCADITRVIPIGKQFNPVQKDIYTIVLAAQKAAINTVRSGVKMESVYGAAARVLTEGLVDLGVLRGKVSKLLADGKHKQFFPHGIGHSLGMDVHDIGQLRGNNAAVLKKGMVITIEPGLYFAKRTRNIAPCGIRIEDDVLVTDTGARVLSAGFPKEISQIDKLVG